MKPQQQLHKWVVAGFLLFSFFGFVDAAYLAASHYLGAAVTCSVTHGCEEVTTSKYSTIGSVPIALFGAAYYLGVFLLAMVYFDAKKLWAMKLAALLPAAGFLISLYLLYLQFFVLHALCIYCISSAAASTVLFALGIHVFVKTTKI